MYNTYTRMHAHNHACTHTHTYRMCSACECIPKGQTVRIHMHLNQVSLTTTSLCNNSPVIESASATKVTVRGCLFICTTCSKKTTQTVNPILVGVNKILYILKYMPKVNYVLQKLQTSKALLQVCLSS